MHVPKRQPADPAKAVNCNSYSHFCSLQDWSFVCRAAAKGRTTIDLSRDASQFRRQLVNAQLRRTEGLYR
jgi:hypothetical protein